LPPDAQIQNGKILRTRVGDKFRYDLVLTIKVPDTELIKADKLNGTIGIDVGFRKSGDTILIGTVMSEDASQKAQEIKAPSKMVSALEHIIELQSELDDAATDLGKALTPLLLANPLPDDHPKFRMWQSLARRPAHVTLSFEKAYKFALWLNREPNVFPKEVTEKVHTWWRSYSRKYREIHNRRKKQLTHRKHFYRETAASIVAQKKLIVLEDINLTDFAETRDKNTKLSNKARAQRFLASLSEFRDAIKNAAEREGVKVIDVDPAYTSKTCSDCGFRNKALKSEKEWACPNCGVVHDRDTNAANNLQKMGQVYIEEVKKEALKVIE
jgi:IS605 OrfB family transposase